MAWQWLPQLQCKTIKAAPRLLTFRANKTRISLIPFAARADPRGHQDGRLFASFLLATLPAPELRNAAMDWEAVAWLSTASHGCIILDLFPLDAFEYELYWRRIENIQALLISIIITKANDYFAKMVSVSRPLKCTLY